MRISDWSSDVCSSDLPVVTRASHAGEVHVTVELRVLGSLRLSASDGRDFESLIRQPKRTALLAYLATTAPRGFRRRDTLLALFWPAIGRASLRESVGQ